jgi:hypothetical protein
MKPLYQVVVANLGKVYHGRDYMEARALFDEYVTQSRANYGRVAAESVYLLCDEEVEDEFNPNENI